MVNVADAFGIELAEVARPLLTGSRFRDRLRQVLSARYAGSFARSSRVPRPNPDAFVAWSYPPDTFGLTEQAIIEDFQVKAFYTAVATAFPAYGGKFGSKINNVLGAGGTNPDDPKIADYRKRHKEVTGKEPDYWASANTYAALEVLAQAIEGVGEADREKVTQYIKDHSFDTVMGELKFEDQNSRKYWTVGQWQDGVFRGVDAVNIDGAAPVRLKEGWN
jgi:branched-chain amino acid transport system substrate-binding protein